MEDLFVRHINDNYPNCRIDSIKKFGRTTINDIFISDDYGKIVKLYNGAENTDNSAMGQFFCSLKGIAPKVFLNVEGQCTSVYNHRKYVVQQYISKGKKKSKMLRMDELTLALVNLHQELTKTGANLYLPDKTSGKSKQQIMQSIDQNMTELPRELSVYESFSELLQLRKMLCEKYNISYFPEAKAIIHGDIKPSNVIFHDRQVFFIDFDYICKGDLLYEVSRAAMLFSDYDVELSKCYIRKYFDYVGLSSLYTYRHVIENLMAYYVQSSFPIKLMDVVSEEALKEMIIERKRALVFCQRAIMTDDKIISRNFKRL